MGDGGPAPNHATVLEDGSDMRFKDAQHCFVLKACCTRAVWHLHAPHEEPKHPVSFRNSVIGMVTERKLRVQYNAEIPDLTTSFKRVTIQVIYSVNR